MSDLSEMDADTLSRAASVEIDKMGRGRTLGLTIRPEMALLLLGQLQLALRHPVNQKGEHALEIRKFVDELAELLTTDPSKPYTAEIVRRGWGDRPETPAGREADEPPHMPDP